MNALIKPLPIRPMCDINEIVGYKLYSFESLNKKLSKINLKKSFLINIKSHNNFVLYLKPSKNTIMCFLDEQKKICAHETVKIFLTNKNINIIFFCDTHIIKLKIKLYIINSSILLNNIKLTENKTINILLE
jgi:hypothetical protein